MRKLGGLVPGSLILGAVLAGNSAQVQAVDFGAKSTDEVCVHAMKLKSLATGAASESKYETRMIHVSWSVGEKEYVFSQYHDSEAEGVPVRGFSLWTNSANAADGADRVLRRSRGLTVYNGKKEKFDTTRVLSLEGSSTEPKVSVENGVETRREESCRSQRISEGELRGVLNASPGALRGVFEFDKSVRGGAEPALVDRAWDKVYSEAEKEYPDEQAAGPRRRPRRDDGNGLGEALKRLDEQRGIWPRGCTPFVGGQENIENCIP